jgi:hypothetical protein
MSRALVFEKQLIADERYECAVVCDVDNDGVLDIVSGAFWYPGPDFSRKCYIGPVSANGELYDQLGLVAMDVDEDGYVDLVTGGWYGETLRWHRNPQGSRNHQWQTYEIAQIGPIETIRAWDIDGDGQLELLPSTPRSPQYLLRHSSRGNAPFEIRILWDGESAGGYRSGHGLGCGDIAGQGRCDIALGHGWLEAPENTFADAWKYHADWDFGKASIPIVVADVNGDGKTDLIVGNPHDYGLDWYEQTRGPHGAASWLRHPIDPFNSQYHALAWADLDNDGTPELVTGKRYRAHAGLDPGEYDPVGLYYFKWTGEGFAKQIVDYGPIRQSTGCGVSFALADLTNNGFLDIVAPGKDGLYVFYNRGFPAHLLDPPGLQ